MCTSPTGGFLSAKTFKGPSPASHTVVNFIYRIPYYFWQWQLVNYWDDCHLELIPRPSSATEMNLQRVFECENAWSGRADAQSDKKREVLIPFFERTPPGTHVRGSQTKLSNIDAVAFNAIQRPDRFSCPLQEPSLHFGRQGFENWVCFLALGLFRPEKKNLEFVQKVHSKECLYKLRCYKNSKKCRIAPEGRPLPIVINYTGLFCQNKFNT